MSDQNLFTVMASLVEQLLSEGRSGSSPQRPAYRPQHSRPVSITEVTQKVRASRGPITLNESEVSVLRKMIEQMDVDPFSGRLNGTSFLNAKDLGQIGLGNDADEYAGLPTDYDDEDINDQLMNDPDGSVTKNKSAIRSASDLIPVEQALVAPLATPHSEEEIPDSVLNSLRVLQTKSEERPLEQLQDEPPHQPAHRPAPAPQEPIPHAELDQTVDEVPRHTESKRKPTEAQLQAALSSALGGSPLQTSSVPISERAEHPDAADYEHIMLEARKRRNPSPAPAQPARRRLTERGEPVQETEAMRAANRAVAGL